MKLAKLAFVCAATASLSAFAVDYTSNEVGILPVAKTLSAMPLTVNFTAADGTALPATMIVKTACLPAGSALYVYDKGTASYTKYDLSGTEWLPANSGKTYVVNASGQLVEGEASAASDVKVARGAAVFLETPSSFTNNFYVAGRPGSVTNTTVSAGANLIGAPTAAAFDLNSNTATWGNNEVGIAVSTFTSFTNPKTKESVTIVDTIGDSIEVPANDKGLVTRYYFRGTDSKWVTASGDTYTAEGCVIPAGQGFWYVRKAGSSDMTITW